MNNFERTEGLVLIFLFISRPDDDALSIAIFMLPERPL